MRPAHCPNFQTCNASVCPLDPTPTVHLHGEQVRPYLLASDKAGAAERFFRDQVFADCCRLLPTVVHRHPAIGRAVAEAAKRPFRRSNLPHCAGRRVQADSGVVFGRSP